MTTIRTLVAGAAVLGTALLAVPSTSVEAGSFAGQRCERLDATDLDVTLTPLKHERVRVDVELTGDGPFCDDTVHVRSRSSAGPDVAASDPHADRPDEIPLVDSRFRAALSDGVLFGATKGSTSYSNDFAADPCWAGIEIHLDDGTPIFEEVLGDGCEMTVVTDFWVDPHSADIHVVQQTGNIQPPHIWTVLDDDTTVLTGLPSGTWYVKVFDGWTPNSHIAVDDGPPIEQSTVYDVADGSFVEITLWPSMDPT